MDDADVILEVPAEWFDNPLDRDRHQRLYASLLVALAELSVTVRPIRLPYAADGAERLHAHGQLVISFHSHGDEGNVLRFKESYVPPYYTADPMGYSGFSKLATEPEHFRHDIERVPLKAAETFVADLRETLVRRNASKYAQPTAEAELPRGPYVFVPLQTIEDPVAGFAHIDQIDALAVISAKARARGWSVVAKRHPLCTARRIEAGLEELSRDYGNLHLSTGSIHPLIAGAEAVVGCNSGVLFEALVHDKPVVAYGRSDFRIATWEATTNAELARALDGLDAVGPAFRARFVAWYLTTYCVHAGDVPAIRGRIAEVLAALDIRGHGFNTEQLDLYDHYAAIERARRNEILNG